MFHSLKLNTGSNTFYNKNIEFSKGDKIRLGAVTVPSYKNITSSNNTLSMTFDAVAKDITITSQIYDSFGDLCTTIKTLLDTAYTETFTCYYNEGTNIITLSHASTAFQYEFKFDRLGPWVFYIQI